MLGDITALTVLDLFAGSGALGIEALSRGAAAATFVERAAPALRRAATPTSRRSASTRPTSAAATPARSLRNASTAGAHTIWSSLDPPYRDARALGRELDRPRPLLAPGGRSSPRATGARHSTLDLPHPFERRYGDTLIRIHGH